MLRFNGVHVERRKMCPDNPHNTQHSILDLSWHESPERDNNHLTWEQRKQKQKETVQKLYMTRNRQLEQKLLTNMIQPSTIAIDEELERHLKEFTMSRSLVRNQQSPRRAQMTPIIPQYSRVQNIMYELNNDPHAQYRLGNSSLLHPLAI